jgi:hypothetical protein
LRHVLPRFRLKDHDISAGPFSPQNASTASNSSAAANNGNGLHSLQLLFKLGTTLKKHFVTPLSQVHERFNGHP